MEICQNCQNYHSFHKNYAFTLNFWMNCIEFLMELSRIFGKNGKLSPLSRLLIYPMLISPTVFEQPNILKKLF